MGHRCAGVRSRLAAAASALLALPVAGQVRIEADFTSRWLAHDEAIELRVDANTFAARGDLRVFAGAVDVTASITSPQPGLLRLASPALRWPQGSHELVVYRIDRTVQPQGQGQPPWHELARLPLMVLDAMGFESSKIVPRAGLQLDGRAAEDRNDGKPHTPRGRYLDAVARAGLDGQAERSGGQWQAQLNTQGTSERSKALRAAELRDAAPLVDLADYRVGFAHGEQRIEIGHVSHGNHPLLISGMASRGLNAAVKFGAHTELSLAAMNGSAIVGWSNPFGLAEEEHRIHALTLATELIAERPGALRAELTLLDASVLPRSGFDQGQVPDAEDSRGIGLRLRWQQGPLRGDVAWARSRHVHPFDPQLALAGAGSETVAVRPVTRDAHRGELHWDLLDAGASGASGATPRRATLSLLHERTSPLYRSLAAAFASDQMHTRLALDAAWKGASTQWHAAHRTDNLARLATLLRTGTLEWGAALRMPLPEWMGAAGTAASGESLWPVAGLSWQQVHQRARNAPATAQSGIAASHRPDQLNRNAQLQLNWQRPRGSLAYTLALSDQDNRQPGRERADFRNLSHQLALALQFGEKWRGQASAQRSRNTSLEAALARWVEGVSLGAEGQLNDKLSLSANLSLNHQTDSAGNTAARQLAAQAQANWRFEWHFAGRALPAQAFVRSGLQDERQSDRRLGVQSGFRAWWVDVGLSISH